MKSFYLAGKSVMQQPIQQPDLTRKLAVGDGYAQLYWPLSTSQIRSSLLWEWPSMQAYREIERSYVAMAEKRIYEDAPLLNCSNPLPSTAEDA